jgi:hypothetical protein
VRQSNLLLGHFEEVWVNNWGNKLNELVLALDQACGDCYRIKRFISVSDSDVL